MLKKNILKAKIIIREEPIRTKKESKTCKECFDIKSLSTLDDFFAFCRENKVTLKFKEDSNFSCLYDSGCARQHYCYLNDLSQAEEKFKAAKYNIEIGRSKVKDAQEFFAIVDC